LQQNHSFHSVKRGILQDLSFEHNVVKQ